MLQFQRVAVTEIHGVFQHIVELPDVSGPVIALEELHDLTGDGLDLLGHLLVQPLQLIVRKQRDVLRPLAEGGDVDIHHVQPVVEVLPELPVLHHLPEILVGGGNDPNVHRLRLAAHSGDLPLLQDPQELRLDVVGELVHLVQKDSALIRHLKFTDPAAPLGAGEGSLLIAEELALHQSLRDGGAVDGDHGALAAAAEIVDGMGHHLFAAAGLAGDQHGGVGLADLGDLHPQGGHGLTFPDDVGDAVFDRLLLLAGLIHGLEGILQVDESLLGVLGDLLQELLQLHAVGEDVIVNGPHQPAVPVEVFDAGNVGDVRGKVEAGLVKLFAPCRVEDLSGGVDLTDMFSHHLVRQRPLVVGLHHGVHVGGEVFDPAPFVDDDQVVHRVEYQPALLQRHVKVVAGSQGTLAFHGKSPLSLGFIWAPASGAGWPSVRAPAPGAVSPTIADIPAIVKRLRSNRPI